MRIYVRSGPGGGVSRRLNNGLVFPWIGLNFTLVALGSFFPRLLLRKVGAHGVRPRFWGIISPRFNLHDTPPPELDYRYRTTLLENTLC